MVGTMLMNPLLIVRVSVRMFVLDAMHMAM